MVVNTSKRCNQFVFRNLRVNIDKLKHNKAVRIWAPLFLYRTKRLFQTLL
jgi:hypothetical protein